MKILGFLLVVAVFTLFGVSKSAGLIRRERTLCAVLEALCYIRSELQSVQTPLPVIFDSLLTSSKQEMMAFFEKIADGMSCIYDESFSELWAAAAETLCLSASQRSEVVRMGQYLGRFPAAEQCAAIDGCIAHLEPEYNAARTAAREGRKLWTGLGLATGLMLAAVLI
jgi:stage III sporulation protein AB